MNNTNKAKRILLIDRHGRWRDRSTAALESGGFIVRALSAYDDPTSEIGVAYDLVILGCAAVDADEQKLIGHVVRTRNPLLVLSTHLPLTRMRSAFLAGASDVANKPYDSKHLLELVGQVFRKMQSPCSHPSTTI